MRTRALGLAVVVAILLVTGSAGAVLARPASAAVTVDLSAVADTRLAVLNDAAGVFGGGVDIGVGRNGASNVQRGLVRFDLTGLPAGAPIVSAELRLTLSLDATNAANGAITVAAGRALRAWSETNARWGEWELGQAWQISGCAGVLDCESVALGSVVVPLSAVAGYGVVVPLGVGTIADLPAQGFRLTTLESDSDLIYFGSREHSILAYRPILHLVYTVADTPTPTAAVVAATATATALAAAATATPLALAATATATATAIPSPAGEGASPLYATFYLVVLGVYGVTYLLFLILSSGRSTLVAIITVTFIAVSIVSGSYYAFAIAYGLYLLWMIVFSSVEFYKKVFG